MPLNKFVPCCGPFIFIRETGLSRLRQRYTVLFYKEGEREQNSAFCGPRGQLRRRRRTVRRAFQHPYEHHPKRFLLRSDLCNGGKAKVSAGFAVGNCPLRGLPMPLQIFSSRISPSCFSPGACPSALSDLFPLGAWPMQFFTAQSRGFGTNRMNRASSDEVLRL